MYQKVTSYRTSAKWFNNASVGISILETLVVLAILSLVVASAIIPLSSLRATVNVEAAEQQTRSFLIEARSRTLAGRESSSYGVAFFTDRVVLFMGDIYAEEAQVKTFQFPQYVYI